MLTTVNMGLVEWNADSDDFSSSQLATNFTLIDRHNHTAGQGVQIPTAGIQTGAITSGLLAFGAVNSAALGANAVGTTNIQNASVTAAKLAPGAIGPGSISPGIITENLLDPNVLPLGTVAFWWRPVGSHVVPGGGWEIMDGRPWASVTNSLGLSTGNMPDMRGAFPQGADITASIAPGIGGTGGSNTISLAHAHGVNAHAHSVPSHAHAINADGDHHHAFGGDDDLVIRRNAFVEGLTVTDTSGTHRTNTYHTIYLPGEIIAPFTEITLPMSTNGNHSHGGVTGGTTLTTNPAITNTDSQLGSTTITPKYVALLPIMLVR